MRRCACSGGNPGAYRSARGCQRDRFRGDVEAQTARPDEGSGAGIVGSDALGRAVKVRKRQSPPGAGMHRDGRAAESGGAHPRLERTDVLSCPCMALPRSEVSEQRTLKQTPRGVRRGGGIACAERGIGPEAFDVGGDVSAHLSAQRGGAEVALVLAP